MNSSSLLKMQIMRLQEAGKVEEAMAAMRNYLELERDAHTANITDNQEPQGNIVCFPRVRAIS